MKKTVFYLMSGAAHTPYAVVSLRSLRRHWDGEIIVYAWPESFEIMKRISKVFDVTCYEREPEYRGKNAQFFDKLKLCQTVSTDLGLYLDADTIIRKPIDYLFSLAVDSGFVATQFCDWIANVGVIRNRVARLINRDEIDQESVKYILSETPMPSVNGGVFAFRPDSLVLEKWKDWTSKVLDIFIADETVLHALMGWYELHPGGSSRWGYFTVARGGAWNCSPKYQPKTMKDEDVNIYHFHGDSNVRPEKSKKGFDLWWPEYQECLKMNLGGMADWIDQIKNEHLSQIPGWNGKMVEV